MRKARNWQWTCFACLEFGGGLTQTHCQFCGVERWLARLMDKSIIDGHTSWRTKKRREIALRIHYGA